MISRRTWLKFQAAIGMIATTPSVRAASGKLSDPTFVGGVGSLAELQEWISKLPNRQEIGSPSPVCEQTGEAYEEIYYGHWARPGDEAFAEKLVAIHMQRRIAGLFDGRRNGVVYWRIPLEYEIRDDMQPIEYRDDGPDIDFLLDRRCVMDRNWKTVKAYCRLTVSKE